MTRVGQITIAYFRPWYNNTHSGSFWPTARQHKAVGMNFLLHITKAIRVAVFIKLHQNQMSHFPSTSGRRKLQTNRPHTSTQKIQEYVLLSAVGPKSMLYRHCDLDTWQMSTKHVSDCQRLSSHEFCKVMWPLWWRWAISIRLHYIHNFAYQKLRHESELVSVMCKILLPFLFSFKCGVCSQWSVQV